jgi:predicted oxidoreductase
MERRATKLQLGQIMKSRNGIIMVIHLEYREKQIVKNQLKLSTKKENTIQMITFDSISRYHYNQTWSIFKRRECTLWTAFNGKW